MVYPLTVGRESLDTQIFGNNMTFISSGAKNCVFQERVRLVWSLQLLVQIVNYLTLLQGKKIPPVRSKLRVKSRKDEKFFPKLSSCRTSALKRITRESHITPLFSLLPTLLKDKCMCLQDEWKLEVTCPAWQVQYLNIFVPGFKLFNIVYLYWCFMSWVNNFSHTSGWFLVFLGWTSTKQRIECLADGHNTVTPVSLEIATLQSHDWCSTEPLCSICLT